MQRNKDAVNIFAKQRVEIACRRIAGKRIDPAALQRIEHRSAGFQ
jgi:hypothetical protein